MRLLLADLGGVGEMVSRSPRRGFGFLLQIARILVLLGLLGVQSSPAIVVAQASNQQKIDPALQAQAVQGAQTLGLNQPRRDRPLHKAEVRQSTGLSQNHPEEN